MMMNNAKCGIISGIIYRAEHYSRGHSIVSQHFIEPESSIPNSQELPTCPILSQTHPVHITLGFTQPLTEISTRNIKIIMLLGREVRRVCRVDNLTTICESTV
jgi:hypothetical protein